MNASTVVSSLALVASATAIGIAATQPKPLTETQIAARVDARFVERERQLVDRCAPSFKEMFVEVNNLEGGADWSPKTLEELFAPLVKIITVMGETEPPESGESTSPPAPPR